MSNIGKQPINVPENIEVNISNNNISVKGQLGELAINYNPRIKVKSANNLIEVIRNSNKR